MDQEQNSLGISLSKMQIQEFCSVNSSFSRFNQEMDRPFHVSLKQRMSIETSEKSDIMAIGVSSDIHADKSLPSSSISSQNMSGILPILRTSSTLQEKSMIQVVTSNISDDNDNLFKSFTVKHQCVCTKRGNLQYCSQYCDCYKYKQQPCIQQQCCPSCIQFKAMTRQKNQRWMVNGSIDFSPQSEVSSPSYNWQECLEIKQKRRPKIFKSDKCQCRNSLCKNKYCVCFTAGKKCNMSCMCENCQNCEYWQRDSKDKTEKYQKQTQKQRVYLQDSGNGKSLNGSMQFQPPNF